MPQQRVVRSRIGRIGRDRPTEPDEEVIEVTDVIVDLRRNEPGFIEGAPDCRFLLAAPFLPETDRGQDDKRKDGGDHQPQQPRSYSARQHQLLATRILNFSYTAIILREAFHRSFRHLCTYLVLCCSIKKP